MIWKMEPWSGSKNTLVWFWTLPLSNTGEEVGGMFTGLFLRALRPEAR